MNEFEPDWVSAPGDTLQDLLEEWDLSKEEAAYALGMPVPEFDKLLQGDLEIDEALASQLSEVFGSTPGFWLRREFHYRNPGPKVKLKPLPRSLGGGL